MTHVHLCTIHTVRAGIPILESSFHLLSKNTFGGFVTVPFLPNKDGDESPSFYQLRIELTKVDNSDGQVDTATAYSKPFPVRSLGDTFERNYNNALQDLLQKTHLLGRIRRRLQGQSSHKVQAVAYQTLDNRLVD